MATATPTIGRSGSMVLIMNGSRIDLPTVTNFRSEAQARNIRSEPLNGQPLEMSIPNGWRGSFQVDRYDGTLDNAIASQESAFWNAGTISLGTIYFYVKESDGSTSTYEFTNVALVLSDAGQYAQEAIVKLTASFTASARNKL